ncbi:MAG: ASKHA domain-containing protein [Bacillota bacterium]|nr:ASKHA domain-containing protein [Bacillota bacterium]
MRITVLPNGASIEAAPESLLLPALRQAGLGIAADCGGAGSCGSCRVRVISGRAAPPQPEELAILSAEELAAGWRLACRLSVTDDLCVSLPVAAAADERKTRLLPLPADFQAESSGEQQYGLAFDIGTTTVAALLWDLREAALLGSEARTNPQAAYGADVITRINFSERQPDNLRLLHQAIIDCLNEMSAELCARQHLSRELLTRATVVGNTTMSHLFLGLSPSTLARIPFAPLFSGAVEMSAADSGLQIAAGGRVHLLPNIAGHVGSDLTGGILASRLLDMSGVHLLLDLGTNGEIILNANGRVWACSTAAGPAFEGACIYHGMRAAAGAIEKASIDEQGELHIAVIGGAPPRGICGSGLIDAAAALLEAGVIDASGRLLTADKAGALPPSLARRLLRDHGVDAFILAGDEGGRPVMLDQKDIRQIQLAKAAIAAGIRLLLHQAGMDIRHIDSLLLAGAFGSYIDVASAQRIGLLPPLSKGAVVPLGNAAGVGASMALLSAAERERIYRRLPEIAHVELAELPEFQRVYVGEMNFPDKLDRGQAKP